MDNTLTHILAATDAKPTGPDRWLGHCPSHGSKRHRDLSIRVTETKILLHCFAGCFKPAICDSLGLELKDLFTDALDPDPQNRKVAARQRDRDRHVREHLAHQQGTLLDVLREADSFVYSRRGLDISAWSTERLDSELDALSHAYHLLEHEDLHG